MEIRWLYEQVTLIDVILLSLRSATVGENDNMCKSFGVQEGPECVYTKVIYSLSDPKQISRS